ncbi:MAG: 2,3-bisphosphoglycerate-independent phosphoglycerate mutase [Gammaproteobacteria bacterium]|nr:2,3-bisphosphoglycerate-independent phosphoglycerate mutase [Gammaproteobacteria bacterium]
MNNKQNANKPVVLAILDGWGYREEPENNAILAAHTPNWDRLWQSGTRSFIHTSGEKVGLPDGQMGNSEVGHLNLGAGRVVYQDYTRVTKAIAEGSFQQNPVINQALQKAKGHAVHVIGLLSPGGVHSHEEHIFAMLEHALANTQGPVYLHAILDGRDTPPRSAKASLEKAEALFKQAGRGHVASIIGRYYAMDRDNRWERVEQAYALYTEARSAYRSTSSVGALAAAYARDENDEFVKATAIMHQAQNPVTIEDGDSVIFMNFRADRARELTYCFTDDAFHGFVREQRPKLAEFVCLTEYQKNIQAPVAYAPVTLSNTLGAYISNLGLKQLRIAETEKYAHVTFFFNGGEETPFKNEDRVLVPSPKVATYDLQPEMHAPQLTDKLVDAIHSGKYDLIVVNYANADMVGHSGIFEAAVKAIEALDTCVGRVATALKDVGGELLVTADHGNAEQMADHETGQAHTAHTTNVVPLLYLGRAASLADNGLLSDIAPTVLNLLGLEVPPEMTGRNLIRFD